MMGWSRRHSRFDGRDLRMGRSSLLVLLAATAVLMAVGFALHLGTARANTTEWPARMTVGFTDILDVPFLAGYYEFPEIVGEAHWEDMGGLDPRVFSYAGVDYTVNGVYYADLETGIYNPEPDCGRHCLFLHVDRPLPEGLTLQVGDGRYDLGGAGREN